jgi:lipoyl(octanoyl) transferase
MRKPLVKVVDLGWIGFKEAWDIQQQYFDELVARKLANRDKAEEEKEPLVHYLLICEHPHVYTLGKSGKAEHLLIDQAELESMGIEFLPINRGGDITYHGPGQIVGYPILDLDDFFTDIHRYLRCLEEIIIEVLHQYGLKADRSKGETGVWFDAGTEKARKVCAMGIKASRWVTMHGFALNHSVDLKYFEYIVPCGIADKAVANMAQELSTLPPRQEVVDSILTQFELQFNCICAKP